MKLIIKEDLGYFLRDEKLNDRYDQIDEIMSDCIGQSYSSTKETLSEIDFYLDANLGFYGSECKEEWRMDYYYDNAIIGVFSLCLTFEAIKNGSRYSVGGLIGYDLNYEKVGD